jgi:hypothetical protein
MAPARYPIYAFDCSCKNRLLRIFSAVSDRFSVSVASCVEAVMLRCFTATCRRCNDLQRLTFPRFTTAFDNRRRIVLKATIPLTKGRLPEASREVVRVRFPRADLQSAPGRPWEDARPALRPVYEKLVRLGQAETDNARFLAKSQEARPGAERWRSFAYARAAVERRQACALRRARAAPVSAAVGSASVGVLPPLFEEGRKKQVASGG